MTNLQLQLRRESAMPRGLAVMCNVHARRAENAALEDEEGREYIDFAAGIAVLNTGHRHPRVMEAIRAQMNRFTHTAFQIVPYESAISLAERINAAVPIEGPVKTAFFTTGAEAIENAVKIARVYTGRSALISFQGGFHGRTMMGLALTGKVVPYKAGFGPFSAEVHHAQFPNAFHGVSTEDAMASLEALFKATVDPSRVAAIIIEPVQGEGGFNIAPPEFMAKLRTLCDKHGILFIADEVQTGFARTGRMFAMEHHSVQPDLMVLAKSLAGGMPLSAVAGRAEIMDSPSPGGLGGTYAANPLAVAAAHAVLDVINEEKLCERAIALGHQLKDALERINSNGGGITDIRGLGSMVAAELWNAESGLPDAQRARAIQQKALQHGLILLTCGAHGNVIRFLYPLTIDTDRFERALGILELAFE